MKKKILSDSEYEQKLFYSMANCRTKKQLSNLIESKTNAIIEYKERLIFDEKALKVLIQELKKRK